MKKKQVYMVAFAAIIIWIGLMIWDQTVGLPDMSSRARNMLIWFPTLVVGFVWAFAGKKDDKE